MEENELWYKLCICETALQKLANDLRKSMTCSFNVSDIIDCYKQLAEQELSNMEVL